MTREPALLGQTVVVIGGSAGIGLETARLARAEGADVVLAGRDPERLNEAAGEVGARDSTAFDANDSAALEAFFAQLEGPVDHVMVTAGGPYYAPLAEMDFDEARRALQAHPMLMVGVARLALEVAPVRVNLIAAGFVDTPLSAPLLGDHLDERREQLRATLPIGRVVQAADVAALAVHIMTNTALTGATYDIYGGQQLVRG
ncbi:MAG: SDR family oxidoreductase [Actinomycetes bacterium]